MRTDGQMNTLDTVRSSKTRWIVDLLLLLLAVGLFLPVYIINRQYARAHWTAGEAIREARRQEGSDPVEYSRVLREGLRDTGSPEMYYRKREQVANWTSWLFLLTLTAGLLYRRWVASALLVLFWYLSSSFHGLRY